jgi:hypothetical protein
MKWWDLILSEMTLLKVLVTLDVLLVAYVLFIPHPVWTSYAALGAVAVGAVITAVTVAAWARRGPR